jgi:putative hydrolases of HD superfamily
LIALLIDDPEIDKNKLVKMAIVHDLAEAIVGDITPSCGVSHQDKRQRETAAMEQLVSTLNGSKEALEIQNLWLEYENAQTKEALLCKDIDKVIHIVCP